MPLEDCIVLYIYNIIYIVYYMYIYSGYTLFIYCIYIVYMPYLYYLDIYIFITMPLDTRSTRSARKCGEPCVTNIRSCAWRIPRPFQMARLVSIFSYLLIYFQIFLYTFQLFNVSLHIFYLYVYMSFYIVFDF